MQSPSSGNEVSEIGDVLSEAGLRCPNSCGADWLCLEVVTRYHQVRVSDMMATEVMWWDDELPSTTQISYQCRKCSFTISEDDTDIED